MSFHRVPMYVGGGPEGNPQHEADLVRQIVNDSPGEGAGGPNHLVGRAENGQLLIGFGKAIINGRAQQWQGQYADWNAGDQTVDFVGNSTSSERHDLIVVRVEDPDFEGSRDRMNDNIIFTEQITNVPSGARTLEDAGKGGYSAIPVMRVEWPAGVTVPIGDYVKDVRELANPRFHYFQDSIWHGSGGVTPITPPADESYEDFPFGSVNVDVPEWAVRMDVVTRVSTVRLNWNGTTQQDFLNIHGNIRHRFNADQHPGNIGEYNHEWPGGVSRTILEIGRTYSAIPYQGQSTQMTLEINLQHHTGSSRMEVDNGSAVIWQVYFRETTAFNP